MADGPALNERITHVLKLVELDDSVFELGLRSRLGPMPSPASARACSTARTALKERLAAKEMAGLVVPFDARRYNSEASIGENLLFGAALQAEFAGSALARQPDVRG